MNQEELTKELMILGIELTTFQEEQLRQFYELMVEYNQKINLTRITEQEEVNLKHFYDSLTIQKIIDLKKIKSLCDVGSGAGFPGIVLKICFPHLEVTLLDSLNKRVIYLNEVIASLHLTGIKAVHTRAEDYYKNTHEQFEVVTSRAVAALPKLVEYCYDLIQPNGYFVAMKGNLEEELQEGLKKASHFHLFHLKTESFSLPKEGGNRNLVLFQKKK